MERWVYWVVFLVCIAYLANVTTINFIPDSTPWFGHLDEVFVTLFGLWSLGRAGIRIF